MTTEQLQQLSTEDFQDYCAMLYAEQERRAKLASIPEQIKELSRSFEEVGGDKSDLVAKVNEPTVQKEENSIELDQVKHR